MYVAFGLMCKKIVIHVKRVMAKMYIYAEASMTYAKFFVYSCNCLDFPIKLVIYL